MMLDLLAPGSTTFAQGVVGRAGGMRSTRLTTVLRAVAAAQKSLSAPSVSAVLVALHRWRIEDPREFSSRGSTDALAYRLWMESKQVLANRWGQAFAQPAPAAPSGCPGTLLLDVYVPEGEGNVETCHGFAYRWAVCAGRMRESPRLPARRSQPVTITGHTVCPVLYPDGYDGYPPAREGGAMRTRPGDIVAMYAVPSASRAPMLAHSLVAESESVWFSAGNAAAFGTGAGRTRVDTAREFPARDGRRVGWVGPGNEWVAPDGRAMRVVYRRMS